MMHEEFEKLMGCNVKYDTYVNIIEPMYMALPNVSKEDFCKLLNKKAIEIKPITKYRTEIKKIMIHLRDTCEKYTDYEAKERLESLLRNMINDYNWKGYWIENGYYYEGIKRGCTYPKKIRIYTSSYDYVTSTIEI